MADLKRKDGTAYCALLLMVSIWGSNFLIAKYTLAYFKPLTVASFRILITTIAFFFVWLFTRERIKIPFPDHVRIAILAFTGVFLNQVLFITGLNMTTPAHAALMVATIPIFVFIFAGKFLKEGLLNVKGSGILISFAGVIILTRIWEFNFHSSNLTGDLIIIANSVAFAIYTILGKPILSKYKPINVTSIVYFYAVWMMLPFYPFYLRNIPYSTIPLQGYMALAFVVILSTFVAYILYYWALARIEASRAAAIIYLQPLIGSSLSIIFGFEAFSMNLLIGGALIIGGVLLTEIV
jgi:drug/metabolite transporter (DMT)-like permease